MNTAQAVGLMVQFGVECVDHAGDIFRFNAETQQFEFQYYSEPLCAIEMFGANRETWIPFIFGNPVEIYTPERQWAVK